ncbi:hypothetical protein CHH91_06655 [Virgibacillus sp. 7505]|uniref:hypothetical protein n=1 Tax=Bacillaceae TaxID=186817 RepID=UPI000BA73E3A|nr:hypothetical protein [Virgibacillus sp. 7505]PAE16921.1 hypothetical protein CHH91_06655 [Virgibacillus sp. 7505]
MKKTIGKIFLLGLLGFVAFLISPTDSKAYTEDNEGDFPVYYFDTKEELDDFKQNSAVGQLATNKANIESNMLRASAKSTYKKYYFGSTSFSNYIWVGGSSRTFNGPQFMDIEKGDRKNLEVWIYDGKGKYLGKTKIKDRSGWVHTDFSYLTGKGYNYKIKLVNTSSGTQKLVQGELYYF